MYFDLSSGFERTTCHVPATVCTRCKVSPELNLEGHRSRADNLPNELEDDQLQRV